MTGQTWGATRFLAVPNDTPEDRRNWLAAEFLATLQSDAAGPAFEAANLRLTPADEAATKASYQKTFEELKTFLTSTGRLTN